MAVKLGKRKRAPVSRPPLPGAAQLEDEIHRFTSLGQFAKALKLAEVNAKDNGSQAAQLLLLEVRLQAVQGLLEARRSSDAEEKLSRLRQQYPGEAARLWPLEMRLQAQRGNWEGIFRILGDNALDNSKRSFAENVVREELVDLDLLANTPLLPADEPLKVAAVALWRAFEAATSGDESPPLPELSRRSPLAPWCLLIKAISCYHRGDDAACLPLLAALPLRSAAALAAPLLRKAIALQTGCAFVDELTNGYIVLRSVLQNLDKQETNFKKAQADVEKAVQVCAELAPQSLDRLRQILSARSKKLAWPVDKVRRALGGRVARTSFFWGLMGRASQLDGQILESYFYWEEFRQHSRAEGHLKPQEEAVLLLDLAVLLGKHGGLPEKLDPDAAEMIRSYYEGEPEAVRAASMIGSGRKLDGNHYFDLRRMFQRSCSLDPQPEGFALWFEFEQGRRRGDPQTAAEAWSRFHPQDPRPLLFLLEHAEKVGAWKKAQGYLERALSLDSLNPRLHEVRPRLLVAGVLAALRRKKPSRLEALEVLPAMQRGIRPALLAALRSLGGGDTPALLAQAATLLGSPSLAAALFAGLAKSLKLPVPEGCHKTALVGGEVNFLGSLVKLMQDFRLPLELPTTWEANLLKQLKALGPSMEPERLESLTSAALSQGFSQLAFACTRIGLKRDGPGLARYTFWRAQTIPPGRRLDDCLQVAAELARDRRDQVLLAEIVDFAVSQLVDLEQSCPPEIVEQVLDEEKKVTKFCNPTGCNCSKCRAAQGDEDFLKMLLGALVPFGEE